MKIMKSENKEPIYDAEDVKELIKHTVTLEYDEVSDITPDVRITLYNAGHTLGSAMVHLHVGNGLHNILYTGDMKFGKTQVLEPASTVFPRLETLILESTYGGKEVTDQAKGREAARASAWFGKGTGDNAHAPLHDVHFQRAAKGSSVR